MKGSKKHSKKDALGTPVVSGTMKPRRHFNVGYVVAIVGVLVVIGLGWFIYKQRQHSSSTAKAAVICQGGEGKTLVSQLLTASASRKNQDATQSISKIIALKGYDKDPNCLYPIAAHYIQVGDATNGRLYYNKLNTVYNAKVGYDNDVKAKAVSLATLKARLEFIEKEAADVKKRGVTF